MKAALTLIETGIAGCRDAEGSLSAPAFNRVFRSFLLAKANVVAMMGRLKPAESYLNQAADLRPPAGAPQKDSRTTHTEALVRANLSIYIGDAHACWREARVFAELAQRSGSAWADIVSASITGRAHLTARRWAKARESLEYALAQAREHQLGLEAEASFLAFLAEAMAGCSEFVQALATAEDAVTVARQKKTLFWELQARISLAGVLLRNRNLNEQTRISESLSRAEKLIEKTGGAVMEPFVSRHRAEMAGLIGDNAGRRRRLQQAHRQFTSMGAQGNAARLASELRKIESHSVDEVEKVLVDKSNR